MVQVYTDGSRDPDSGRTGIAVYNPQFKSLLSRKHHLAVYSVELLGYSIYGYSVLDQINVSVQIPWQLWSVF